MAPVGEIVVLANVFEFGDQNPRFLDPSDVTTARVIYYSDDVSPSQDLNFSNIPLLAPSEYGGNPVGIQIIVLELDRTSGPAQSLIRRLAELGTSSGLIPGGPVAETLLSLGSSLLEQNSDDMIFEYRMVLDPASTGQAIPSSAPFEEGRYVLLRTEFRNTDMLWQNLRLDHNDGRLYEYPSTSDRPVATANRTYFTVNVVKHPAGTRPSGYAFTTLATFNENLERAMNERAAPLSEVNTVLTRELARVRARSLDGNLGAAWTATVDKARLYSSYLPAAGETCTLTRQAEVERDQARIAFYNNAISFIEDYNAAKGEKVSEAAGAPEVLDLPARRAILSRLAEYFAPFNNDGNDQLSAATLSDVNAFEARFLNAASTFADAVLREAGRAGERSSCARLVADSKATP
ncbi:hypothetical protein [Alteraurantiacibacter palmitatis]|uniref:Uncharacterized protein n=1 Tax=Alteraurantiacibacter palmitatis TaxID=2054628 RepID=A0ABV7E6X7_9SPHN